MASDVKGALIPFSSMPTTNQNFKSKVTAPKNPKLIREPKKILKVNFWERTKFNCFKDPLMMFYLRFKLSPSAFIKEMSMDTKQKLAATHEMYLPQIIELLDMGETSLQKVFHNILEGQLRI